MAEQPFRRLPEMWGMGCDGSLGCDCPKKQLQFIELSRQLDRAPTMGGHGTLEYAKKGCKCQLCLEAAAMAERKRNVPLQVREHGRRSTYQAGCRCGECRLAHANYHRDRMRRIRAGANGTA